MSAAFRPALILWVVFLLACGAVVTRMTVTTDLAALLSGSAIPAQELLIAQLRDGVAARLLLIAIEGADPETLAEASGRLTEAIQTSNLFGYVHNGDPAKLKIERDVLMRHRYVLSSAVAADHFTAPALRASLERQMELLGSPAGAVTKALLPADPTGELAHILSELSMGDGPSVLHGVWFSRDGSRAQLIAETRAAGFDLDQQGSALTAVRKAFASLGLPESVRLLISGPGVFAVDSRATIERDSWRLSAVAGTLVVGLLLTIYRSVSPVLLSLLPVLSGLLAGVAAVQIVFGSVHGITLGFGATLIGEAVDYPAYLFTQVMTGERFQETLSRVWPTLRLAVLTTVFGALTMLLSSFTGLSQLGVLSAVGVSVAGLVTRWVLPALSPQPMKSSAREILPLNWTRPLADLRSASWVIWVLCFGAMGLLTVKHQSIWDHDLANLSPVSQSAKDLDAQLRAELGAPDVRYVVVVRGPDQEQVLTTSEHLALVLHRMTQDGLLTGYDLPSRYLPSRETQSRRLAALPDRAQLAAALTRARDGLSFRSGLFEPFLRDVEQARAGKLLESDDLRESAFSIKLRALLLSGKDGWIGLAPLRGVSSSTAVADRLAQSGLSGARFLDLKGEAERLVDGYRRESLRFTAAGFLAITAVLWWGLRNPGRVGRVLVPPVVAVIFVVTILTVAGERLSLFHLVSLLLVIGIGLNYALFFDRRFTDEAERRRNLLSLTVCILSTLSAFGALAFSHTAVLHAIGLTVSLGAFFSMMLSAALVQRRETIR
ncbi:membrane protein [Nitrospira sp. KM1]|uniref:MMPL family transporter n=1 Tax=Nitrospira sp. KM1 TaxID=1936990 RepID=UPI0013A79875|nr:MMPL family transporter [Nitrospira sp. KM1]BCA55718.1 membrane protein [Nitrospira sp. KM1]